MRKLLIIPLIVFGLGINNLSAQKTEPIDEKTNTVLFGYISNHSDEFFSVIRYIENHNMKVIDYCQEERLILVQLNERNKDYTELFNECYLKTDKIKKNR